MVEKLLSLKSVGVFRNVVGAAKQVVEIVRAVKEKNMFFNFFFSSNLVIATLIFIPIEINSLCIAHFLEMKKTK